MARCRPPCAGVRRTLSGAVVRALAAGLFVRVVAERVSNLGGGLRAPGRLAAQAGSGGGCARRRLASASCCCRLVGVLGWS